MFTSFYKKPTLHFSVYFMFHTQDVKEIGSHFLQRQSLRKLKVAKDSVNSWVTLGS